MSVEGDALTAIEKLRGLPVTGPSTGGNGVASYIGPFYPAIDRIGAKPIVIEVTGPGTCQLLRASTAIPIATFTHGAPITVGGTPLGPYTSTALAPIQEQEWSEWCVDAVFYLQMTPNSATVMQGSIKQ